MHAFHHPFAVAVGLEGDAVGRMTRGRAMSSERPAPEAGVEAEAA
jgi:hypothetical protein